MIQCSREIDGCTLFWMIQCSREIYGCTLFWRGGDIAGIHGDYCLHRDLAKFLPAIHMFLDLDNYMQSPT